MQCKISARGILYEMKPEIGKKFYRLHSILRIVPLSSFIFIIKSRISTF